MTDRDKAKRAAGEAGAGHVEDGMCVGLGTGSTTAFALKALGRRVRAQDLELRGVPTSPAAARLARAHGIPCVALGDVEQLDLAFDGADEVDPASNLIKGRGAAHTREKVIAAEARRFVVLVDPSKQVDRLGERAPVPVEIVPMACTPVARRLEALGAVPELRTGTGKDGPVVTDQGLWVLDAHFDGGLGDAEAIARALDATPGVLDHGLFLGMAAEVVVGHPDGTVERRTGC